MFACAGVLITEGAMSSEFQADDHYGGIVNGR